MLKKIFYILMLVIFPTASFAAEPIVMGYWENWSTYQNYPMPNNAKGSTNSKLAGQISGINTLAYAFLEVADDGAIQFLDIWSDLDPNSVKAKQFCKQSPSSCEGFPSSASLGNFDAFTKTPVKHHVISVGGGGYGAAVEKAFDHPDRFVSSLKMLVEIYPIDSLDIDYEPANGVPLAYVQKFIELTRKIKESIPSLRVSYAISANCYNINKFGIENWKKLEKNLDYISIMGYDMHGAFDSSYPYTALHSALIAKNQTGSAEAALKALLKAGIAKNKIILGMPLYGLAVGGVQEGGLGEVFTSGVEGDLDGKNCSTRLGAKNLCSGSFQYKTLVDQGYTPVPVIVGQQLAGVYAYHPEKKIFVSYDSPESAAAKAQYAVSNQLAGVMFWALRYDRPINDSQSVLAAVSKVYGLPPKA